MKIHQYFDDISLFPYKNEFKNYSFKDLNSDVYAGLTVALLTLPQAMAFAFVAGLPLSTSLFASIFSCIIAALFGSSKHLIAGPSNALAILIQYSTAEILYNNFRDLSGVGKDYVAFQIMCQVTLIVAILQLLAVGLRLGRLTQFVSYSVVLGYVAGAAAGIIIGQLFVFCGIPNMEGVHTLCVRALYFATHLQEIHWSTFLLGAVSLTTLLFLRRWKPRMPAALITMLLATGLLHAARLTLGGEADNVMVIGDAGEISGLIPQFMMPSLNFKIMNSLIPFAFAVALLSILETSSVAKSIASFSGQRLSINQEILGLGLGNLTSALCGAMPISGSTSRSNLNFDSGAKTRLGAISGSVIVGLILLLFEDFVTKIPLPALASILFVSAATLVKKKQLLLCLKSTKSDAFVFWMTFLSCLFFGIDIAFYIGVCLSIMLYLKKAAVPQVLQYMIDETGRIKGLEFCRPDEGGKIRFIKVKGELFFGAADLFQATLKSVAEDDTYTKVIILQLKNARDIDATACLALFQLHDCLKNSGRHLLISGITLPIWEVMSDSGLVKAIGKENLFLIDERNPNLYFNKALNRAKELAAEGVKPEVPGQEALAEAPALAPVPGLAG